MARRLTKQQKSRRSLVGGVAGLLIGFWMIFVAKDNFGFLPAILGVFLLLFRRK